MYDIGDHVAELLLSMGIHTLYIIVRLKQSPVVHRNWHLVIVKRHHLHILCYPYCLRMIQTTGVQCHQHHINGFFVEKISKLRVNFPFDSSSGLDIAPLTDGKLDCLRLATSEEIQNTILSASNSSCALDPILTWLLKQCIPELLPIITAILYTSLRTGSVPALFKYAIIRPHLKKSSLDTEELKNYRPVSNLHYMSKVLEKLVVKET